MPAREESLQIVLGGQETLEISEYRAVLGVFEQPCAFDLTLGHPAFFRYLAEAYPPYTPYELWLAGRKIQTGTLDGFRRVGSDTKTQISLFGRDILSPLVDTEIAEETTFSEKTFYELTQEVFKIVGIDPDILIPSNEANRKAISGHLGASATDDSIPVDLAIETGFDVEQAIRKADMVANGFAREDGTPYTVAEFEFAALGIGVSPVSNDALLNAGFSQAEIDAAQLAPPRAKPKPQFKTLTAEVGDTWWDFLVGEYRRVGLFLWATSDGKIVLSTPNPEQAPIYRIIRSENINNILHDQFSNDVTGRFTDYTVYSRNGGGRKGIGKAVGKFVDDETNSYVNRTPEDREARRHKRHKSIRDKKCKNKETAENLARRICCEDRRKAWRLRYCIQGHTIEGIGTGEPTLWTPDTIVEIHDDDFGLYGPMYIEKVEFVGENDKTFTWLSLVRPEDLFFRNEVESTKKVPKKIAEKGINTNVFHPGVYVTLVEGFDTDQDNFFAATGLGKFEGPAGGFDGKLFRDESGNLIGERAGPRASTSQAFGELSQSSGAFSEPPIGAGGNQGGGRVNTGRAGAEAAARARNDR